MATMPAGRESAAPAGEAVVNGAAVDWAGLEELGAAVTADPDELTVPDAVGTVSAEVVTPEAEVGAAPPAAVEVAGARLALALTAEQKSAAAGRTLSESECQLCLPEEPAR